MKKATSTILLVLMMVTAHAQTMFFDGTWKEAFAEAKKQNKYLFIDCYTDWCGWCKVADKKTFPDEDVAAFLNENFVSVKVDMERGEGVELAMKYRVTGFPSYLMFTPDGSYAHKMTGYIEKPADFIDQVKMALDEANRSAYPAKLTDNVAFPAFYESAYANRDQKEKKTSPEMGDVDAWVAEQKDLKTIAAWSVIYRFPLNESNTERFLDDREAFVNVFGKAEVLDKIGSIANQKLGVALKTQKESDLLVALDFADRYMDEHKEENKAYYRLRFCEGKGDWTEYAKCAQGMIDFHGLENHLGGVNNYSWTIYLNTDDKDVLNTAIGWMKRVVEIDPLYMYLDTYAALHFKAGNYDQALLWANKAIEVGKNEGENVQETEELKDQILAAKAGK